MNNIELNVQAIFDSIDGEANGFYGAGELTTFIRLKGCNLNCIYCDTTYAQNSKPENWIAVDEIMKQVHFPKVTITGGEPLLQRTNLLPLVETLLVNGYDVSIETNGTELPFAEIDTSFRRLRYIVDFKLPSSGMMEYMKSMVFASLCATDVIKFVISNEEDYGYAKMLILEHPRWVARKVFSPVVEYEKDCNPQYVHIPKVLDMRWPRQLAKMMIQDKVNAQFSLQIHKVLWPGVKEER